MSRKKSVEKQVLEQKIKLNMDIQDGAFSKSEKIRTGMGTEKRKILIMGIILFVLIILSFLLTVDVTNVNMSPAWMIERITSKIAQFVDLVTGNQQKTGIQFFLCQFIAPVLAGSALATAGACYQGVFHNPMASPTLLGIQSGGSIGALVYILFVSKFIQSPGDEVYESYGSYVEIYQSQSLLQHNIKQLCVLAGCILIVSIVVAISATSNRGKLDTVSLMLGGTIFTSMINTVLTMIKYYLTVTGGSDSVVSEINSMISGRFISQSIPEVILCMAVPIVICLCLLFALSGRLNALVFGEDEAIAMGLNVNLYRIAFIALSTVMTATVISFCGTISFVGLMVPQFARLFAGSDFKVLLPVSAMSGALFMLVAFDFTYMIDFRVNMGTIVNAAGGLIFFIAMIIYRRRGNADWT